LARGDRFVLRDVGRVLTLGGGVVLDPLATPLRGSDDARASRLRAMDGAGPEVVLRTLLDQEGAMDVGDALWRAGTAEPPPEARRLGSLLVSSARLTELQTALLAILDRHHHARPLEKGRGLEVVRSELRLPTSSFEALVAATPSVAQEGSVLRLGDHSPTLAPAEEEARTRVLRAIEESGFAPPLAKDLDAEAALLRAMVEQGDLVAVGDFYLTRARADEARTRVTSEIRENGPQTVAQIRDLLGTTRKYAVPLCEWLDASGVTVRREDVRLLGPRATP
ncbi:MAG: selenocysteine-specific elongation factor, partial [Actinomycetota bacterium]|nr:selenocysteine-specific elongation factor [Actinomycetota bacterium]